MSLRLFVDSAEFWAGLVEDLDSARREVFVQALTFEADRVGRELAGRLLAARAPDRRLLVDSHSRFIVSDKLVCHPRHLLDAELRREVRATADAVRELREAGVPVRYTNPLGPLAVHFPRRNHKKLMVIDGRVAYLGGINFSEHNFAWHDVMIRTDDPGMVELLRHDFETTWSGRNLGLSRAFPGAELHLFDGVSNPARFETLLERLDRARRRVQVECGYLTSPFCERLVAVHARGVPVTLLLSEASNWPLSHEHAVFEAGRAGIDVRLCPGPMVHMKTMLVDDEALIVGSANFELWSYWFQQELVAVVTEPSLVAEFRARVAEPDLARSRPCTRVGPVRGWLRRLQVRLIDRTCRLLAARPPAPA